MDEAIEELDITTLALSYGLTVARHPGRVVVSGYVSPEGDSVVATFYPGRIYPSGWSWETVCSSGRAVGGPLTKDKLFQFEGYWQLQRMRRRRRE